MHRSMVAAPPSTTTWMSNVRFHGAKWIWTPNGSNVGVTFARGLQTITKHRAGHQKPTVVFRAEMTWTKHALTSHRREQRKHKQKRQNNARRMTKSISYNNKTR